MHSFPVSQSLNADFKSKLGASPIKTCPYLFCYIISCNLSFLFLWNHYRCSDADEQYEKDNDERSDCIYLKEIVDEHLHTNEHQQHAYTHLQIAELIGYRCQEEEERSQAQDGEDIGEEHYKRVE